MRDAAASSEASIERLNNLTNPSLARTMLFGAVASWSELAVYVQNLVGLADQIETANLAVVTAKLNDLQRILYNAPPMNSLFAPKNPAPVDVFTRILYLQNDLRDRLRKQGFQVIMPAAGEGFDPQRHECSEADLVWNHEDPSKHNTIYAVRTVGFENQNAGRILKKAAVKKWMFDDSLPQDTPNDSNVMPAVPIQAPTVETTETETSDFPVPAVEPESEEKMEDTTSSGNMVEVHSSEVKMPAEDVQEEILPTGEREVISVGSSAEASYSLGILTPTPESEIIADATNDEKPENAAGIQEANVETALPTQDTLSDSEERRRNALEAAGEVTE